MNACVSLTLWLLVSAKERPEGLLSDEERIRKPQLVRMWKQRLQNLEPLKKTRPEYYERQKKALEEVNVGEFRW